MSSFFTAPSSQKKRKRPVAPEFPKKRLANGGGPKSSGKAPANPASRREERDESISGSESDDDESFEGLSNASGSSEASDSDNEGETAAEKRLRLAERYLENVKEHVDEAGFDAADIDRDLIAERLQEDVAETKGKVYRQLGSELAIDKASQTFFRTNTGPVTSITSSAPYFYTATKDLHIHKGSTGKKKEKNYQRHTGPILAIAASPDGRYVVTGGADRKLIVHDAETLKSVKVFNHHRDAITGLAFRRGTNQLYSCSKDRTVKVWSLDELAYVETLFGHQDEVVDIDALAQERCVSVGARDRTARLWKVLEESQLVFRGGAVDKKPKPGVNPRSLLHEGSMDRIAMIDDDLFITGSDNGTIALWSVQKKKPVYLESLAHGVDPAPGPTEGSASAIASDNVVAAPPPRPITALRTIPYSDVFFSGSWDGYVRVWQLSEDKRRIESLGVLSSPEPSKEANGVTPNAGAASSRPIVGVVNGITVFERGDRGKDGICVIAAVSKEHRFGRWKIFDGARNGGVVFEVPRIRPPVSANGVDNSTDEEG
uniref:Ribosomal RNA-processing protein 9 n=1 Tax=Bionectria ochroleuca TaxID=29856 RepID=A0A0B7KE02_BIOOC